MASRGSGLIISHYALKQVPINQESSSWPSNQDVPGTYIVMIRKDTGLIMDVANFAMGYSRMS